LKSNIIEKHQNKWTTREPRRSEDLIKILGNFVSYANSEIKHPIFGLLCEIMVLMVYA
jgi:hypothetical protein